MSEKQFAAMLSVTEAINRDIRAIKQLIAACNRSLSNIEQIAKDWPL